MSYWDNHGASGLLNEIYGWDYTTNPIRNPLEDREISMLTYDLLNLIRVFEEYKEGDWEEHRYTDAKAEFKKKWFTGQRRDRTRKIIDEALEECREELYKTYGI